MKLTIDGTDYTIPTTFKAIRAAAKLLGSQKLTDLEKTLGKVGYDNAHRVAAAMLRAGGESIGDDQVEDAITDAAFPVRLVEEISKAISGPTQDQADAVGEAVGEGN